MGMRPRGPASRRMWRPDLAYVVGLIATDGNLSPSGRHVCLVSRDVEQLLTFATVLDSRNRIGRHRGGFSTEGASKICLGDRLFYEWLRSIGLTPRKSLTIGALAVPDEYFRDFLRGHLDGDGSIIVYVDRYCTKLKPKYVYQRLYIRFLSASRPHVEWLQKKTTLLLGVDGYLSVQRRGVRRSQLYTLHFAKKEAIKLLRWMYYSPDVPCLKRKRAIAEPFLTGDIRDFRHPPGFEAHEVREAPKEYYVAAG